MLQKRTWMVLAFSLCIAGWAMADSLVGVASQPYVKQWQGSAPNASVAAYNSYDKGDASVDKQMKLISTHFERVATYGAGYAGYYPASTPWNQVDDNYLIGLAAGWINEAAKRQELIVSQGIYQQTSKALQDAEINGAFTIAQHANNHYPNTVRRLIFTNEYVTNEQTTNEVLTMIKDNKQRAKNHGLAVGVRSNTFGQLTGPKSGYKTAMENLVKQCDFIMVNIYPSSISVQQGTEAALTDIKSQYNSIKSAAKKINPNVNVIVGETGWPSQGKSFNDTSGKSSTVANAKAYFEAVSRWSKNQGIEVYIFEAIDEPWKSNKNATGGNVWQGPDGAEGHFGLYTYTGTGDQGEFKSKWNLKTVKNKQVAGHPYHLGTGDIAIDGGEIHLDAPGNPDFPNDFAILSDSAVHVLDDAIHSGEFLSEPPHTLTRNGDARLLLTGNSLDTFKGTFVNQSGRTYVNGALGGTFENNSALYGSGTVTNLVNRGVIHPGNSVGTLKVNRDFINEPGSSIFIEYLPRLVEDEDGSDTLEVEGKAILQKGSKILVSPFEPGFVRTGAQMTVIETGDGVIDNGVEIESLSRFVNWAGIILANDFVLTATRDSFTKDAANANQAGVAAGLDALSASPLGANSASGKLIHDVSQLSASAFQQTLEELSPQRYDVANIVNRSNNQNVTNTLTHYLASRRFGMPMQTQANASDLDMMFSSEQGSQYVMMLADDDDEARQKIEEEGYLPGTKMSLWAQGFYLRSSANSEANSVGFDANTGGGIFGLDYAVADNLLIGLSFAFTGTHATYDSPGGNMDMYSYRVGPYLSWEPIERLFVDFSVSYAFNQIESTRATTTGGTPVNADANYNGHDISVYLGAEYDVVPEQQWYVALLIGLNYIWFHQEGFTESGAGASNLVVDSQNTNSLDLRVGGRFAWMGQINDNVTVVPEALIAYRRELLAENNDDIAARFVNAGGTFEVPRGPAQENGIEFGAGMNVLIDHNLSVYARYTGTVYNSSVSHLGSVGLSFGF